MNNSGTLVTVAMLSAMLEQKHTEYIDLISPFVLSLTPKNQGEIIDKSKIIEGLKIKYGFEEFPIHLLSKILKRYTKLKHGGYFTKYGDDYCTNNPFDYEKFENNQRRISQSQNSVMSVFQQYLKENTKYINIDLDKAREMFLRFLEQNGLALIVGIEELRTVTIKDYDIYHVARFVLTEYEAKSETFNHIEDVVRGFFVYKSIYYFSREQKVAIDSKLKNTSIYLDTSLLIEALGYNTQEGKAATRELIKLIRENNGKVKTFSHLEDEVAGILTKYARDPLSRPTMRLEYLYKNNYSEVDVIRLRSKLERSLKGLGITIEEAPEVSSLDDSEEEFLDSANLSSSIQEVYGHDRTQNDVKSIVGIYKLRSKSHSFNIENCKAILVTSNSYLSEVVNSFYHEKLNNEIGFTIGDLDLTALLWLRSWDKKTNIPCILLIENAYAACQPSPELIDAFTKTVNRLQQEDQITDEEALVLRTQRAPRDDLINNTQNDVAALTEKMVLEIRDRYIGSITGPHIKTITELRKKLVIEKKKKEDAIVKMERRIRRKAENLKRCFLTIAKISFALVFALGFISIVFNNFILEISWLWKMPLIIIGVLGFLDIIKKREGYIEIIAKRLEEYLFSKFHSREMNLINELFGC